LFKSKRVCPKCYEELKQKEEAMYHSSDSSEIEEEIGPSAGTGIVDAMIYVMSADGVIDERELETIVVAFNTVDELSYFAEITENIIKEEYNNFLSMDKNKFLLRIRQAIGDDLGRKIKCLYMATGVAFSDNELHQKEIEALQELATTLGLTKQILDKVIEDTRGLYEKYHDELNL